MFDNDTSIRLSEHEERRRGVSYPLSNAISDIKVFALQLSASLTEHVKKEDDIRKLWFDNYTRKAVLLFYVDKSCDFLFSFFRERLEDLVHIVLFCLTLPVRWIFSFHLSRRPNDEVVSICRSNRMCEKVNNKNKDQDGRYRRMSTFGVMLRKLEEEEKRFDIDVRRIVFIDFKFQTYDSVNNYTNLATIMVIFSIYVSAVRALSFSEHNSVASFINWFGERFHSEPDLADVTLICWWIIISLIVRIVERFYFLSGLTAMSASEGVLSMQGLLFWNSLRKPTYRLLRYNMQVDSQTYFHALVTEFQLRFVRLFCDADTFLKMRRKYHDSKLFLRNQLSFHKDIFGFVIALVASLVVKYFIEGSYDLEFIPRTECIAAHGNCIGDKLENECWCGLNLLNDLASSIGVALLGALGSVATVRTLMNQIFKFWRQKKLKRRFAYITGVKTNTNIKEKIVRSNTIIEEKDYDPVMSHMIIPCNADIDLAIYGSGSDELVDYIIKQKNNICSEEIFKRMSTYVDVTEQIKDYLFQSQGNAFFSIIPNEKRCLIISACFRGGDDGVRDVNQVFRLSDKDNEVVWERELFTWTDKHHESEMVQGHVSEISKLKIERLETSV